MDSGLPGRQALSRIDRLGRAGLRWLAAWWRILHTGAQVAVLALTPATYNRHVRLALARHMYLDTAPILAGFTLLCALASLVITRIVVVTAMSYGLSRYALEMVVRVLVLELIPLTAALFVAMRCTIPNGAQLARMRRGGRFDALRALGHDPLRTEMLPRVAAGVFACFLLAALSCTVALVLAYLAVYGFTVAGLGAYARVAAQVFSPVVCLIFAFKTIFFSLAVAVIPMASDFEGDGDPARAGAELSGLVRMFAVLLLIEIASLAGNYY